VQTTEFAGSTDRALDLALAADGNLVAAGSATIADNPNFAVARYDSDHAPLASSHSRRHPQRATAAVITP
jgi:hypothetical protein